MKLRRVLFVGALLLAMAAPLLLTAALLWFGLADEGRQQLLTLLAPRAPLTVFALLFMAFIGGVLANGLWRSSAGAALRLRESLQVLSGPNPGHRPQLDASLEMRHLATAIGALADQRDEARADVQRQVATAQASLEVERNRLAALVADLPLPVVVCNLDGRILLYNNRARLQARALAPDARAAGAVIGLGRSIYGVFERSLIAHSLETLHARLETEGSQPLAHFITTTQAGQLIRVQIAPVVAPAAVDDERRRDISGYVLVLENITRQMENGAQCDRAMQEIGDAVRSSLAGIRARLPALRAAAAPGQALAAVEAVDGEVRQLSAFLDGAAQTYASTLVNRWPLEEMLGKDMLGAAVRRIETRLGLTVKVDEAAADLWVKVDSYSLIQALTFLAARLQEGFSVSLVRLRLSREDAMALVELRWSGVAMSTETILGWQLEPMHAAGERTPLTLRDVTDRHGGELTWGRESAAQQSFFRIAIPLAAAQDEHEAATLVQVESRPEFYDFDLFHRSGEDHASDDTPLEQLSFTVFDTETTGLEPSAGDEIIQIGAVRIVNGRLLRQESIDQLIDPQRPLRPESIPIHGISEEMVRGQPVIAEVLPQFHAFCEGTVLVAHNAAFDMRFLQLKEEKLGLRFTHPLLDTLLLSAVIHPNQESHKLEAIAQRLGVTIIGRHTALGDAIVTAEVFLAMLPLLAAMGLKTLGEVRAAAEKTYYARLKY